MKATVLTALSLAATCLCGSAFAQDVVSSGERTRVHACFYECKPGPTVRGNPTWRETTTLLVGRLDAATNISSTYSIYYLDGDRNFIARSTSIDLLSFDLDEIHICRTLQAGGITPPRRVSS